jgi:cation diffusion facilitator CzcD-associated flavoprotein CzcO
MQLAPLYATDDFKLSGTEWPKGVKDFPDAKAVEAYIAKFVYEHNLAPKVTHGVSVTSAVYDKLMVGLCKLNSVDPYP